MWSGLDTWVTLESGDIGNSLDTLGHLREVPMPWSQTSRMDQRTQFIADYLRELWSVTELCDSYGISRKTAYKWIARYLRQGPAGLEERPRRPNTSPNRTPDEIQYALLEARRRHPSWGGKKLLTLVHKSPPRWELPHRSTVCAIL